MTMSCNLQVCLCGWHKTALSTELNSFSKSWLCKRHLNVHWVGPCCLKNGKCAYHASSQLIATGGLWASQVQLRKHIPIQSCVGGYIPLNTSYTQYIGDVLAGNVKVQLRAECIGQFSTLPTLLKEIKSRATLKVSGKSVSINTGIRSLVYMHDPELNGAWLVKTSQHGIPTIITHIVFAPTRPVHAVYTLHMQLAPSISTSICFTCSPFKHPGAKEPICKPTEVIHLNAGKQIIWKLHRTAVIQAD